jgi:mycothiol synthase
MAQSIRHAAVVPVGMPVGTPAVPDPPAIPGLTFCGIRLPDDLEAFAELGNLANRHDAIEEHNDAEDFANWLAHNERRDPARDIVLAQIEGRLVATGIAGWELDNDGGRNYAAWGLVHPEWRRRGLGSALLRWVEARQRQVALTHPAAVAKRLESWSYVKEAGRNALLETNGYRPVRYWFEMERPTLEEIPDVPLPAGFEFRPARSEDMREAFDVEVSAFRDHFGGIEEGEEAYQRMIGDPRLDISLWVLVWHEGRIVGESLNRIPRAENAVLGVERGRVVSVAVLREWRRRGLGRAIVAESLKVLRDAGMTSARLGVDAENPHGALGMYESLGFGVVERGRIYRKALEL